MLEIIDTLLLVYLCVLETMNVYKIYKPKRKYNRKIKSNVVTLRRDNG